jgi:hypothetical protein
MLSAAIAEQLCDRGHDAVAVGESPSLRGLPDADLFDHAQREQRALVTYNRDDFLALDRDYRDRGSEHNGIVILNPRRFPQGDASAGALVTGLAAFVSSGPPYPSFIHWLQ